MENFAEPNKSVGIVLDISLRHDAERNRLIDCVKQNLINLVKTSFEDSLDSLYLYHPDIVDPTDKYGLQVHMLNSYDSDGWAFNLNFALKQTLYSLALQDFDMRKYLILVTDRITNIQPIQTIQRLNDKDGVEAQVIVIGIGDIYNKSLVSDFAKTSLVTHIHLSHHSELSAQLIKETSDDKQYPCCETDCGSESIQLPS
jgi:hypothetical protein